MKRYYAYEADLEADCTKLVTDTYNGMHRKLDVGPGSKGQLDHAYWLPRGVHLVVEFKLPGKPLSPKQAKRVNDLRHLGHEVHVIDSYEDFSALVRRRLAE